MNKNEAIAVRAEMINGQFELSDETLAFMTWVRQATAEFAKQVVERAPATCDVGRFIAGIDALQATKNLFCDASILGNESNKRKRIAAPPPAERKD